MDFLNTKWREQITQKILSPVDRYAQTVVVSKEIIFCIFFFFNLCLLTMTNDAFSFCVKSNCSGRSTRTRDYKQELLNSSKFNMEIEENLCFVSASWLVEKWTKVENRQRENNVWNIPWNNGRIESIKRRQKYEHLIISPDRKRRRRSHWPKRHVNIEQNNKLSRKQSRKTTKILSREFFFWNLNDSRSLALALCWSSLVRSARMCVSNAIEDGQVHVYAMCWRRWVDLYMLQHHFDRIYWWLKLTISFISIQRISSFDGIKQSQRTVDFVWIAAHDTHAPTQTMKCDDDE